jgi:hypothetical protein
METRTLTLRASPGPGTPGGPEVLAPTGAGRCGGLECTQGNDLTVCFVLTPRVTRATKGNAAQLAERWRNAGRPSFLVPRRGRAGLWEHSRPMTMFGVREEAR